MKTPNRPNARLRLQRRLHGWTLADVAAGLQRLADEYLGVDQYMVSRWERGVRRPSPRYVRLLCRLFDLPADQLGLVEGADEIDSSQGGGARLGRPAGVERRDFLAAAGLVLAEVALHPLGAEAWDGLANAATVEAAGEVIPRYRRLDGAVPSGELVGSVDAHLRLTLQLLRSARTQWASRKLAAAASEAASFAAWLYLDLNDRGAAQQHYRLAIEVGGRAEIPLLIGYQLGSLATVAIESGNPTEALALCRAAERQFPKAAPTGAKAWLWSLRATAHAGAKDTLSAQRALEAAQSVAQGPQGEPVWPWLTPFDTDKLAAARGMCELRLGRTLAALEALHVALASPSITIRRRGELLVDLATAHARRREPDQACHALDEALTIGARRRSPLLLDRIRSARARLDHWQNLPEIAELDERLHTTWF